MKMRLRVLSTVLALAPCRAEILVDRKHRG